MRERCHEHHRRRRAAIVEPAPPPVPIRYVTRPDMSDLAFKIGLGAAQLAFVAKVAGIW